MTPADLRLCEMRAMVAGAARNVAPTDADTFMAELRAAKAEFDGGTNPRRAAVAALGAILCHAAGMDAVGSENLLSPLVCLWAALDDIDRNAPSSLLGPLRRLGPKALSSMTNCYRGVIAFVVERLTASGLKERDAHSRVAAKIKDIGVRLGRDDRPATAETIKEVCREYEKGRSVDAVLTCSNLSLTMPKVRRASDKRPAGYYTDDQQELSTFRNAMLTVLENEARWRGLIGSGADSERVAETVAAAE